MSRMEKLMNKQQKRLILVVIIYGEVNFSTTCLQKIECKILTLMNENSK